MNGFASRDNPINQTFARFGFRLVRDNGRRATIFSDDALLVSYPRSGNTWLSFLLTNLTHSDEPTTFNNLDVRCPDIHVQTNRYLRQIQRPRLLKSHESFHPAYPRVVYLVRDPRDVAVSFFRFLVKTRALPDDLSMDRFIEGFVDGEWGADYGSWGDHVGSWKGARAGHESFFLLRYEDLHAQPAKWLGSVATFLRIAASEADCERAVRLAAPNEMRRMEIEVARELRELKDTRLDIPFVGAAEVGRGARELSEAQQRSIAAAWGELMSEFGYLPASPSTVSQSSQ